MIDEKDNDEVEILDDGFVRRKNQDDEEATEAAPENDSQAILLGAVLEREAISGIAAPRAYPEEIRAILI